MSAATARCCTARGGSVSIARPGKHGVLDRDAWWARGKPCEVVAAYGVDPVLFMLAAQVFGIKESELEVAGGMMGRADRADRRRICQPADPRQCRAGGRRHTPSRRHRREGPLGEFTGYYGRERAPQPVMEIKALHHRRSPILTAALMAKYPSCEIGAYYAIMRSARILDDLERIGVPGVVAAYAHPAAASGWGVVVVSVQQQYAGHCGTGPGARLAMPGGGVFHQVDHRRSTKTSIPTDFNEVLWALSTRCNPTDDLDLLRNTWSTGLDPSQFPAEARPYGSKVLINACKPHRHLRHFRQTTLLRRATYERVADRWPELGFAGPPPKLSSFHPD